MKFSSAFCVVFVLVCVSSCERKTAEVADADKPKPRVVEYFDKKYLLEKLPDNFYGDAKLNSSFTKEEVANTFSSKEISVEFKPLGYNPDFNFQYTQTYKPEGAHESRDSVWELSFAAFPDMFQTHDSAYAQVHVKNLTAQTKKYSFRLFWQNTSYWVPVNQPTVNSQQSSEGRKTKRETERAKNHAENGLPLNYYNGSLPYEVTLSPNVDTTILIPYTIGRIPKAQYLWYPSKDRARAGNYEFALLFGEKKNNLFDENLNMNELNPFAEMRADFDSKKQLHFAYVQPSHFKFIFLEEFFDGTNDLNPNHYYYAKRHDEKPLCDTCSGWFRSAITERWTADDFFTGSLLKRNFVKAEFGNRRQNTVIDSSGITLRLPASQRGNYQKTWGEFLFVPAFQYGHVTVRAKFCPMYNNTGTPNGIVHNLWLYERDPDDVDTANPFHYLVNYNGVQPYEIDFEIWSSGDRVNNVWDDSAFVNYSIVDYMRNAKAEIKPDEEKVFGSYKADRFNHRQINIPGAPLPKNFFDSFHTYELFWMPDHVRFLLDGKETALITGNMAAIPDSYMFLWIGSPIYQDGTYYSQSSMPFLEKEKRSVIDYIKIE